MNITIPDDVAAAAHVSEAEARIELAVGLYRAQRLTMGQASRVAALPQAAFMQELGRRDVAVNYGVDDLEADLKTLADLRHK